MMQELKNKLQRTYVADVLKMLHITDAVHLPARAIHAANVSVHNCAEGGYLVHLGGCPWLHYDVFAFGTVMYYYRPWRTLHPAREAA